MVSRYHGLSPGASDLTFFPVCATMAGMVKLRYVHDGDTIGICSPSHVMDEETLQQIIDLLKSCGFRVRTGRHILAGNWGYAATKKQRAEDFNQLIRDPKVTLVMFEGGESAVELLPLLDYQAMVERPKLYCSFSDGTTILQAIHSQTGIPVFYGPTPHTLLEEDPYTMKQFDALTVDHVPYKASEPWTVLREGSAKGELTGGYLRNFTLMLGNPYFSYRQKPYLLFLEDHEQFTEVGGVAGYLECIAQTPFIHQVKALLFGHYSDEEQPDLLGILERFGDRFSIPVAYCHDFGHGSHHAVIPIGLDGRIDMKRHLLRWQY